MFKFKDVEDEFIDKVDVKKKVKTQMIRRKKESMMYKMQEIKNNNSDNEMISVGSMSINNDI